MSLQAKKGFWEKVLLTLGQAISLLHKIVHVNNKHSLGVGKTTLLLSTTFRPIFIPIKREVHTLTSNTNKLTYITTLSQAETSYVNV